MQEAKEKMTGKEIWKRYGGWCMVIVLALLVEIFIFNFRTFQSLFYDEIVLTDEMVKTEGLVSYGSGHYAFEGEKNGTLYFEEIPDTIHNMLIDISVPTSIELPYLENGVCYVTVYIGDEASEYVYDVSTEAIVDGVDASKYLWFNSMGAVHDMEIDLSVASGFSVQINEIVVNAKCPLLFSVPRFLIVATFFLLIYALRNESLIWKVDCMEWTRGKKWSVAFYVILVFVLGWFFISQNASIDYKRDFTPYQELAHALAEGQTCLLQEPPKELVSLENPYDYYARKFEVEDFKWDFAYYEGKYYVYFGVVPCIMFHLPFYMSTGLDLPDEIPTLFGAVLFALGVFLLLRQIVLLYFPKTPFPMLWLAAAVIGMGCQIPYFLVQPEAYNLPILFGMVFSVFGLYGWFLYLRFYEKEGGKKYVFLALGSFMMALVFGCRPQMGLFSFLAFPLFLPILKGNAIDTKKKMCAAFTAVIPYVIVAIPLMTYNYVRFGSVFDFGAMYNLTIFDMTQANYTIEKVFYGLFEYLFRLPSVDISYPFVDWMEASHHLWQHMVFYSEPTLGGLFSGNIILFSVFLIYYLKKDLKNRKVLGFCGGLLLISMMILIFDAEIVGAVYRYLADFSFAVFLACFIVLFMLYEKVKGNDTEVCYKQLFVVFCLLSLVFNLLVFVSTGLKFPLNEGNTLLYYQLKNALMFW